MNWISVNDKLPPNEDVKILIMEHPETTKHRKYGNVVLGIFWADKFHYEFNKGKCIPAVTHWMPLPEQPLVDNGTITFCCT